MDFSRWFARRGYKSHCAPWGPCPCSTMGSLVTRAGPGVVPASQVSGEECRFRKERPSPACVSSGWALCYPVFPSVKWRYSVSTARVFRRLCPWCIAGAQQTLASFFCSSGTRGRARGTEGHFMPCLAALVVRRAGPERESVGDAPHCGQVISARKSFQCQPAEFWAPGWAVGHFFLEWDT